jgi:hypothetical protein
MLLDKCTRVRPTFCAAWSCQPAVRLRFNAAVNMGMLDVGAEGFICREIQIAFNADAERTLVAFQFGNPHAAKLGKAGTEVAEAEGQIVVLGIKLGQEPCSRAAWVEQLDQRLEVCGFLVLARQLPVDAAIFQKLLFEVVRDEGHRFSFCHRFLGASGAALKTDGQPLSGRARRTHSRRRLRTRGPAQRAGRRGDAAANLRSACAAREGRPLAKKALALAGAYLGRTARSATTSLYLEECKPEVRQFSGPTSLPRRVAGSASATALRPWIAAPLGFTFQCWDEEGQYA